MYNKLCITCDNNSFQIVNNIFFTKSGHVIPQWFKKIGNYSLLPPPINRNDALNPFKTELQEYHQPDADININIDIKKIIPGMKDYKARWVYFWAAEKRNYNNITYILVLKYLKAYSPN